MKFRCTHNSIRLRLKRSNVDQLAKEGLVEDRIYFGPDHYLSIQLIINTDSENIAAELSKSVVKVILPKAIAKPWIDSDDISLEAEQTKNGAPALHILVEKDLSCIGRNKENKADYFEELGEKDC
jgi:hypothetical protein